MTPQETARHIYQAAVPILKITGLGGRCWLRNDQKKLKRTGPWLSAKYEVLNPDAWRAKSPCIYFISGDDGLIRYTGISRNGAKHRWRESPAIDAETLVRRPKNELHHSQCWQHIEQEYSRNPSITYEVRCITAPALLPVIERLGPPLSGFSPLALDHEGLVAALERWLCNNQGPDLVPWNIAMTNSKSNAPPPLPPRGPLAAMSSYSLAESRYPHVDQEKKEGILLDSIQFSSEGLLTEMWAINDKRTRVFPHLISKRKVPVRGPARGLEITLTGRKSDYHLVDLEQFLDHIAKGHFKEIGRVRMRPKGGGQSNGFAVRSATMSEALLTEIEERQKK